MIPGYIPAQTPDQTQSATVAEQPKPEAVLRQMVDYLSGLPKFSCQLEMSLHLQAGPVDRTGGAKMTLRLERPNRLALLIEDQDSGGVSVVSDGKTFIQYVSAPNRYVSKAAPASFAELADAGEVLGIGLVSLPAAAIPYDGEKLYQTLTGGVKELKYVDRDVVVDVECHRLRLVRDDMDWDIWIEAGERPLARKIAPDFTKRFANGPAQLKDAKMDMSVQFLEWNLDPTFTEADFAINLPADAEQVGSISEVFASNAEPGPHPLLGQPAPPFKTIDLDEKPIDLAAQLGKKVVMLDFWATWCGPCIQAMPELDAVAKEFADRDVVFYAVNVAEDAETVKEFLKTSGLAPPVVMDLDGNITQLYRAEGIPQTVLIGKDGKVQVVHVGFSEGLGDILSVQIEDLLAGKDLAGAVERDEDSAQISDGDSNSDDGPTGSGISE
jgi:peroxiredoxin